MSIILAAVEPAANADPGLPYQAIGVVLSALVAGITGIIIAVLQRNKPSSNAPTPTPSPPTTAGSFVLSETDWIETRNRAIRAEAALEALRHEYGRHEELSQEHMGRTNARIELIIARLGGPML